VLAVVLRYEDIVDLRRAADELALSPEELTTHLRRVPELARTLGSLLARGGVQRQVFEDSFARLAQELPQRSGGNASGEIRAHERTVTALAWEARGRRFASADAGGEVRVHELASKRSISLVEHKGEVRALAFSTDGRQLLSAGSDRVIVLWDLTVNKRLKRLVGHTDRIRAVAFGPNGRWAVSAGEDRTIRLWDLAEGKERRAFTGHTGTITALAISDDGKRILSGSTDRTARLWHAETGKQLGRLDHTGEVLAVAFSPRGDQLLSGASDRSMTLFHADRPTPVRRLTEQPGPVVAVGFSRNERSLLSVTIARESSGEVHVHHLSTGRPLHRVRTGAIQLAALNRQGSVLVGKDREVRIMTTGARTNEPRTK
jgi:WD40 repeat protein